MLVRESGGKEGAPSLRALGMQFERIDIVAKRMAKEKQLAADKKMMPKYKSLVSDIKALNEKEMGKPKYDAEVKRLKGVYGISEEQFGRLQKMETFTDTDRIIQKLSDMIKAIKDLFIQFTKEGRK